MFCTCLLYTSQVGTGGQVELFAVHVADVSLLRSAGGRRVGGVQSVSYTHLDVYKRQPLPLG